ncbi:bifunctional metallophosphatase/5'-nucleotidase [Mycoplasma flocculare]|uniref:5'-nucleotidase lipoprotein n=1 Tax=Mesomycoplasma flocculare ATCC 27399 TaxID=743971 RepID=A0A0A8E7B7_MESFC|nr:5'-nucleotidase C-terminal domain-containing protein [Mesomycoplasma flocculare]AJC50090.1 5'-nucleotidase lipoprotein [Mesomycoplasma flocculare ATCC 27399]ENX50807.1 5'-nucleotidase precursor [Mesomycoplasma flocculare ATCC 27716]MXR13770.1 bifunctional metallophosphatase/5'-nucleotidase [Mesomycoplasma flocculare]
MKKNFLLTFSTFTTFAITIPLIVSCKNEIIITSETSSQIRDEYFNTVKLYSDNLKEFQEKIKTIRKTKPNSDTDEIVGIINKAQAKIDPLINKANFLFTKLHELEKKENSRFKTVKIFHTNDEHGRLEFDDGKYNNYSGMDKTGQYLKRFNKDLLLSAGDLIQGLPLSDTDKGKTISKIAKYSGYDSVAIGNHEFDYGIRHILDLDKEAAKEEFTRSMPFISANIYWREPQEAELKKVAENVKNNRPSQFKKGQRVFQPYKIKELSNGLKVAIIGLTTPDTKITSHPKNSFWVEFKDPVSETRKAINEIKEKDPSISFIIATTHLGTGRTKQEWTSDWLAKDTGQGLDLIIDGHSHTYIEIHKPNKDKNVWVTQTEAYAKWLGDIDLVFDTKTGQIIKIVQSLRDINQINIVTKDLASYWISELKKIYGKENEVKVFDSPGVFEHIQTIDIEKTPYWIGRLKPTSLGMMTADAIAWDFAKVAKEQVLDVQKDKEIITLDNSLGLVNGGGLRTDLNKGPITKGDILGLSPFGNRIVTIKLKGEILKKALEYGLSKGRSGAFAQLSSNIEYNIKVEKGLDSKTKTQTWLWKPDINSFKINKKPIDDDKFYYLSTNDFISVGGDGYSMLNLEENDKIERAYEGGKYIDSLIKYCQYVQNLDDKSTENRDLFAHKLEEYLNKDFLANQKVEIPQAALVKRNPVV